MFVCLYIDMYCYFLSMTICVFTVLNPRIVLLFLGLLTILLLRLRVKMPPGV